MPASRPGSTQQRLLPAPLEHWLNDLSIRVCGGLLVAFAATSWLALLSWQLRTGSGTRTSANLLGAFGAGLSDMLVQTIGIAVIFLLVCPMVWGLELLASVRWISRMRLKIVGWILGVMAMAGFASGLPGVPGWPLLGGAGGMLGDIVYNIVSSHLARFGVERDSALPATVLALGGGWLIVKALGIAIRPLVSSMLHALFQRTASASPAVVAVSTPAAADVAKDTFSPPPSLEIPPDLVQSAAQPADEDSDPATRAFAERFAPSQATAAAPGRAKVVPILGAGIGRARDRAVYRKPSLNLMTRGSGGQRQGEPDVQAGAATLIEVLNAFGVKGEIREARPGPVVTRYELEPVRGTKIARIIGLADDFARELGAHAVRISPTPGRTTIGIEIPNDVRASVVIRDILESDGYTSGQHQLPIALGKGIAGEPITLDLARMPHLLVAGTTGSGKSVGLNAMIISLLYRHDPSELRLLLIDPKMLELSQYDRIPHLLSPVITDPTEAITALDWAVAEMEERYRRMAQQSMRNIETFNAKVRAAKASGVGLTRTVQTGFDSTTGRAIYERQQIDDAPMPYIVIVIDELADLMVTAGKRVEGSIQRLAQKARAAGIHLVMATQRPSVDVVTGTIKANFPVRISFRVASKIDSRTILNEPGAEQLLGHGDMLLTSGSGQHLRIHGAYLSDAEIERVAEALREQGEPQYVDLGARIDEGERRRTASVSLLGDTRATTEAREVEEMYRAAVAVVVGDRKVSPGHLHRRMGIGEDVAAELIKRMEQEAIVGPVNLLGRRAILAEGRTPPKRARQSAA